MFDQSNRYEISLPSKTGKVNAIPTWPIVPEPYEGRVIGSTKADLKLVGGFGVPSAGMLKISEGTKSFGVLGQTRVEKPAANDDGTIPAYDIFAGATRGSAYPEPRTDCSNASKFYTHLTIIPKRAVAGKKLKIDMRNIPFADKDQIQLTPPTVPAQIGKPILAKAITPVGGRYFSGTDQGGSLQLDLGENDENGNPTGCDGYDTLLATKFCYYA